METLQAFAKGNANRGKELMVFDWHKAARLIRERKAKSASAGLANDWEWTGGLIFDDSKPNMDDYTYLASTWAIPEVEIDGVREDCCIMQGESPKGKWDSKTKWPRSALDILAGKGARENQKEAT